LYYNLGLACQRIGNSTGAVSYYRKCLSIQPGFIHASLNLSLSQQEKGDYNEAASVLRESLEFHPDSPQLHGSLASVLYKQGNYYEAMASCKNAIRILPRFAEAYCQLGQIHTAMNNSEKALLAYKRALTINPLLTDAYICISQIEGSERSMERAIEILETAIAQTPHDRELKLKLGKICINLGMFHKAGQCFRDTIELDPSHADAHYNLGLSLKAQSRLDKSFDEFVAASRYRHDFIDARIEQACIKNMTGHAHEALEIIKPLIVSCRKKSAHLYSVYGEILKTTGQTAEAARVLQEYVKNASTATPDLESVHYLLGSILDEKGKYDEAFKQFNQANRLSSKYFNPVAQLDLIDSMRKAFSNVSALPHSGITSAKPIFIVGMPRSGTSLVEQILDSHALICGAGETTDIADIFQQVLKNTRIHHENFFPSNMQHIERKQLHFYAADYLERISNISKEARHITDKLPQNFIFLGFIQLLFPEARVIHCHRNPFDTCLSIYFHNFGSIHSYSHDLKSIANYYFAYQGIMSHWKNTLDLKIMDVKYEDLVSDMGQTVKNMIEYLDLEWDDNCMEYYKNKRTINTFSREQIRKPIYASSIDRWKNYKNHIAPLESVLGIKADSSP
jgi:tetratricopeptide (TPR) repeat protein